MGTFHCDGTYPERPLRCLIVEDQLMFLQLLRSMLQALPGIEISAVASSQAEALAYCQTDPPDLLLLDLSLPDGDGIAVADSLAQLNPRAQLVVLSGQASSFICPAHLQPMVRGVVDKTAAFSTLQQVIATCLDQPKPQLTPRQQQIYGLIGQGLSNKEIARATALTVATVETHRKAIAQKLGVRGAELIRQAALLGELSP